MTIEATEPGLRERKRLATRRAIQIAVLDLAAERGLDNITVDEISRVADISPRTFFNYFVSKEEALIGDGPSLPGGSAIDDFVAAGPAADILTGIGELLAGTGDSPDTDLTTRRRDLLKQYPQLFAIRMATMRQFEDELAGVVSRRLRADDATLASDPVRVSQRARLITLVAFAAMKHAWACWADANGTEELSTRLRSSFSEMRTLLGSVPAE